MNIVDESFKKTNKKDNKKIISRIILVSIVVVVILIIAIIGYLVYLEDSKLKLSLNNEINTKLKDMLLIENDGTVYFPIKNSAQYFNYESFNGEYGEKSEEASKCYVQSENEIANIELGSNKIYKLDLDNENSNYEYVYTKKPIKAVNGILYGTEETIEKIFNVTFEYDRNKNRIYMFTTPYLIENYSSAILDYGYTEIDSTFVNQKAVVNNILVVKNGENFGVIDLNGNIILEAKYENITYLPNTGDFLVSSNGKKGILSKTKDTKVQIIYDNIELLDSDAELYLVEKDGKFGAVDFNGNIKIHAENDAIGIDITPFETNNIKNKYILVDNLIPVQQDEKWGLFNKKGNKVVDFKYDNLGYKASSNKNALNLLVIPNYNVIVASEDGKYTLINSSGEELFATIADDIYMTISGGKKNYYIAVNDKTMDAEEFLDKRGVNTKKSKSTNTSNSINNTNTNNSADATKNNERRNTVSHQEENNTNNEQEFSEE